MPQFLRLREGWLTVGLLALLLFSVTLSIQQAQWSDGLSILTPITIVGLASGLVLAKVRGVPRILLDVVGILLGIVTVLLSVASIMTDTRLVTIQDKVQDLLLRTGSWVGVAIRQEMSDDLLVFILSLALVAWVLSYSSAYFVFKSRQLWWALVPCGIALLINLSYSPVALNSYIIIYMFSALLLMIRFNLLMQEERWQRERVNYSPTLSWGFLWAGSLVSVMLAVAMWFVPATNVNSTLNTMWGNVSQPWDEFQNRMGQLWSQVPGNQSLGGYSAFGNQFVMGGALSLSDSTAMTVKSNQRLYWRAMSYDQYDGIGWTNTAPETLQVLPGSSSKLSLEANQQLISEDKDRVPVTYTVQMLHPKDDLLFAATRPVELSAATRLNVSWRTLNVVYDVQSTQPLSVPLELRTLLGVLQQSQAELRLKGCDPSLDPMQCPYTTSVRQLIQDQQDSLSKRGLSVSFDVKPNEDFQMGLRASGQVPVYDDLTSVSAIGPLAPNTKYSVTSLVSTADEKSLRDASTNYDSWLARYLNLPATVPQRVRELAQEIVQQAGATNPYDEAKAIEAYLRTNFKYNTSIPNPPEGVDRIYWFLFQEKEGYCEYYAGAMTVMLRSVGVPARMTSGYAPGRYDAAVGTYTVRESDAHTWPEVYFPGYGWVQFEPTPSQSVVTHTGLTSAGAQSSPEAGPVETPPIDHRDPDRGTNGQVPSSPIGSVGTGVRAFGWGTALALTLAALLIIFTWLVPVLPWAKRRMRIAAATFYYGRMLAWSRLLGLGPSPHQTPYEFGESIARELPGTSLYARSISRAYVRERFSRDPADHDERIQAHRAWESLRKRFFRVLPSFELKRVFRRRRP